MFSWERVLTTFNQTERKISPFELLNPDSLGLDEVGKTAKNGVKQQPFSSLRSRIFLALVDFFFALFPPLRSLVQGESPDFCKIKV